VEVLALVRRRRSADRQSAERFQVGVGGQQAVTARRTGCTGPAQCGLSALPDVDLDWTATSSTEVTGYELLRSTDGDTYITLATLSDRTTTTYQDTTVATNTTYAYLVRAVRNSWYVDSTPTTITTPASCP
jgi:hypothetical protein